MRTVLLALSAAGLATAAAAADCDPAQLDLRSDGNSVRFAVEVVATPEDRATGLMNRESMPQFAGMLFVYDTPQPVSFWMKNTLIPLDMLFIDETGTVTRIAERTTPLSTDSVFGGEAIQYVLEINGGMSETLGLGEGAEIRHPAIAADAAAWPCAGD